MGDRVRVGEVLAAIGSIGLALLLAFGAWFDYESPPVRTSGPGESSVFVLSGAVGARALGWFAVLIAAAAAAAGLVYLFRVLTSKTTQRPMLQAPVAFAFGLLAFFALVFRLVVNSPTVTLKAGDLDPALEAGQFVGLALATDVTFVGWLGLMSATAIMVGTWHAMADDRTTSKAARQRTRDLLDAIPVRPAPPVLAGAHASSDASIVADDQVPTYADDRTDPPSSTSPSGGPA
ncbi:MAG: hypothetical protein JHD16_12760 [Solirubrobacteraceae bacterium]|nr:hypothetical protein [Solirubrobacteraceae bacterium]